MKGVKYTPMAAACPRIVRKITNLYDAGTFSTELCKVSEKGIASVCVFSYNRKENGKEGALAAYLQMKEETFQ